MFGIIGTSINILKSVDLLVYSHPHLDLSP